ncbi:1,4-alpha-glucan branching enzyme, partial [Streptomyces sp. NPDC059897]
MTRRPTTTPAPVPPDDRNRLLAATHHDPHGVLGAHAAHGGIAFRTWRPYAQHVAVTTPEGLHAELHDDGDGFFTALLQLREIPPAYELEITYADTTQRIADSYALLPSLGDLDLHLVAEGRHERLWDALGARPMEHQGIQGTRFTVWAPNAQGIRVVGTFNYWDGAAHSMRSLGSSGVWELFVPDIGEGELYKFEITRPDGSKTMRADPLATRTEEPPANSSMIHASHYTWGDEAWLEKRAARPVHESAFSVYEVHLP